MPNKPQPVPPIYQPEIAAEAIWFAATHRRRAVSVGGSTWLALLGQWLSPLLMDRYLGRTAVEGQQTGEPDPGNRADNLAAPIANQHATHGAFGAQAHRRSPALWMEMHREALLLGALAIAAGAATWWQGRKHRRPRSGRH
jgi:hypothetical protein